MKREHYDRDAPTASEGRQVFLSAHPSASKDFHTDEELWRAFREGSKIAFKEIYERNADLLYIYGKKITGNTSLIEDKIQDLFLELWSKKTNLGIVKNIKAYLFTAFRNKLIDALKRSKKEVAFENEKNLEIVLSAQAIELLSEDKILALTASLNRLSSQRKEAIFLRYYNNLSCAEVAEIMKIKTQSVYNMISSGLMIIKETLKQSL
ncbi:MAG: sigma-70 family RNA polymerase sigma factor [Cyclobacteriaceae bacterium]|nr:sigma-70 family RNA polymerase sigma factor [Cyclobacteriaceae bacterium]